jgi:hypothetical protein
LPTPDKIIFDWQLAIFSTAKLKEFFIFFFNFSNALISKLITSLASFNIIYFWHLVRPNIILK